MVSLAANTSSLPYTTQSTSTQTGISRTYPVSMCILSSTSVPPASNAGCQDDACPSCQTSKSLSCKKALFLDACPRQQSSRIAYSRCDCGAEVSAHGLQQRRACRSRRAVGEEGPCKPWSKCRSRASSSCAAAARKARSIRSRCSASASVPLPCAPTQDA